jgi:hypothetical protein
MAHPALPTALLSALLSALMGAGVAGAPPASARQPGAADAEALEQYQRRLGQLFHQLDRNGDGRLDRQEVRANPYLQRHFDRLDRGGKGFLAPSDLR